MMKIFKKHILYRFAAAWLSTILVFEPLCTVPVFAGPVEKEGTEAASELLREEAAESEAVIAETQETVLAAGWSVYPLPCSVLLRSVPSPP